MLEYIAYFMHCPSQRMQAYGFTGRALLVINREISTATRIILLWSLPSVANLSLRRSTLLNSSSFSSVFPTSLPSAQLFRRHGELSSGSHVFTPNSLLPWLVVVLQNILHSYTADLTIIVRLVACVISHASTLCMITRVMATSTILTTRCLTQWWETSHRKCQSGEKNNTRWMGDLSVNQETWSLCCLHHIAMAMHYHLLSGPSH